MFSSLPFANPRRKILLDSLVLHIGDSRVQISSSSLQRHFILFYFFSKLNIKVERTLRRNCKAYGVWHHREWVLSKGVSSTNFEFCLLDQFLKADSRNFQGWTCMRCITILYEFQMIQYHIFFQISKFLNKILRAFFQICCSIGKPVTRG